MLTDLSGPLLVTVTVQITVSPVFTVCFETSLTTTKSALGPTSVVLLPGVLLPGVSEVALATFLIVALVMLT